MKDTDRRSNDKIGKANELRIQDFVEKGEAWR